MVQLSQSDCFHVLSFSYCRCPPVCFRIQQMLQHPPPPPSHPSILTFLPVAESRRSRERKRGGRIIAVSLLITTCNLHVSSCTANLIVHFKLLFTAVTHQNGTYQNLNFKEPLVWGYSCVSTLYTVFVIKKVTAGRLCNFYALYGRRVKSAVVDRQRWNKWSWWVQVPAVTATNQSVVKSL